MNGICIARGLPVAAHVLPAGETVCSVCGSEVRVVPLSYVLVRDEWRQVAGQWYHRTKIGDNDPGEFVACGPPPMVIRQPGGTCYEPLPDSTWVAFEQYQPSPTVSVEFVSPVAQ